MNILMFNGLLFLLFMWTSAEMGPETEHTEELQVYANESRVNILARKRACENLDGKCIKTKRDCPSNLHLETKPGRPFCSKNHRCCYPDAPKPQYFGCETTQACGCGIVKGKGCNLNEPKPQYFGCQCKLTGALSDPTTKCNGTVVSCSNPGSDACTGTGEDLNACKEGVFMGGNCNGYPKPK